MSYQRPSAFLFFSILFSLGAFSQQKGYVALREAMVKEQLKERGISSTKVLDAMRKVERHLFVPPEVVSQAYEDHPVPIGEGQTISQPYIVAFMTDALLLKGNEKILEIGTGSGYQAAILGELCKEVYTIEINEPLAKRSAQLLKSLNYSNVFVLHGNGYLGWPEKSPFDRIIVTCSPSHVPQPLTDQLKEGGKMIIPVGNSLQQELWVLTKSKGKLKKESVMPVLFVPMKNDKGERY
jgi:protein-L-isoaspartate(D-aspartate) O-methyltransferase